MKKRRRTRSSTLLIKQTEGKTFAEVFSEVYYNIDPEYNGAVLIELDTKTRSTGELKGDFVSR